MFIPNAGIPVRWWTIVSKTTFLSPKTGGFIGTQEAEQRKGRLSNETCLRDLSPGVLFIP